jgi:hypothetical protein
MSAWDLKKIVNDKLSFDPFPLITQIVFYLKKKGDVLTLLAQNPFRDFTISRSIL